MANANIDILVEDIFNKAMELRVKDKTLREWIDIFAEWRWHDPVEEIPNPRVKVLCWAEYHGTRYLSIGELPYGEIAYFHAGDIYLSWEGEVWRGKGTRVLAWASLPTPPEFNEEAEDE